MKWLALTQMRQRSKIIPYIKQKLGITQAFMGNQDIIILCELFFYEEIYFLEDIYLSDANGDISEYSVQKGQNFKKTQHQK